MTFGVLSMQSIKLYQIIMEFFNHIRMGNLEKLKLMVEANPSVLANPDARGFTPLVMATYSDQVAVTKYFLEQGAPVNYQDPMIGNTALMGVCFKGNIEMIQLLLEHGADVNLKNKKGSTALIFATQYGQAAAAKLLINAGAATDVVDVDGNSALICAKQKGMTDLVALLEH